MTAPAPVSEADVVALAPGIAPADVTLHRDGADLVVAIGQTQAQLRVKGHFNVTEATLNPLTGKWETWYADRRIEAIRFADSTVWDATDIAARTVAGAPNTMTGTTANDTFTVDDAGDAVVESAGGGSDVIRSSVSYALRPNVERLTLTGFVDLSAWSNASNPVSYLDGNAGNNTFNGPGTYLNAAGTAVTSVGGGEAGYAVMAGGTGDDTYWLRPDIGGQVVETADAGDDTVVLSGSNWIHYTLPADVENLRSEEGGTSYPAQTRYRTGNALDNTIEGFRLDWTGAGPHNVIDGGPGADTMIGFGGIDVFIVDHARDRVVDRGSDAAHGLNPAADEIRAAVSYVLPEHVEILTLTGSGAIDGTGNDLANTLDGAANGAINRLRGRARRRPLSRRRQRHRRRARGRGHRHRRAQRHRNAYLHAGRPAGQRRRPRVRRRPRRRRLRGRPARRPRHRQRLGQPSRRRCGRRSARRRRRQRHADRRRGQRSARRRRRARRNPPCARASARTRSPTRTACTASSSTLRSRRATCRCADGWLSIAGGNDRVHLTEGAELRFADGTVVTRTEFNAQLRRAVRACRRRAPTC